MPRPSLALRTLVSALLLGLLLPLAAAHGHDESTDMDMSMAEPARPVVDSSLDSADTASPNYFTHPEHRGLIYAHIAVMTLAWVFVLPVGESP